MAASAAGSRSFGLFPPVAPTSKPDLRTQTQRQGTQSYFELDGPLSKKLARISEREGEDAALTGGTRSLHRRLLALNIYEAKPVAQVRRTPVTSRSTALSA